MRKKLKGGLSLMDPDAAMNDLLSKWIIRAGEPGDSNLHFFLKYRLSCFQPERGSQWKLDLT